MGTTIILSTCGCDYDDDDTSNKCLLRATHKEPTFINSVLQQSYEVGYTYSYYYATDGKTEVPQATCPM